MVGRVVPVRIELRDERRQILLIRVVLVVRRAFGARVLARRSANDGVGVDRVRERRARFENVGNLRARADVVETSPGNAHRFETGLVEPREFVEQLSGILDIRVTYEEFCEIWSCIFLPHTLVPESILEGLRRRYRLLVLSNTNALHFAMVRQSYPILRHFDDFVLSYEVKAMKPAPAIYREAIARAQCRAEECFYTDDIAEYVEGARKEGIDAVQFVSGEQLERDLAARDIQWS